MGKSVISILRQAGRQYRVWLAHRPILYALVGAVGIVLVWKGVDETASYFPILNGPVSLIIGVVILIGAGLLVPFFAGESIVLSGMEQEEKMVRKVETEEHTEGIALPTIMAELKTIEKDVEQLQEKK
jgi:hypothetical protein